MFGKRWKRVCNLLCELAKVGGRKDQMGSKMGKERSTRAEKNQNSKVDN